MRRLHVLHVEDNPDFASLTKDVLEEQFQSMAVETVQNGEAALAALEDGVDCIVSDYDMPGMNGIELLEIVRESQGELPFILYTGKGSEAVASDAISAGVTDYLQKGSGLDHYELLANRIQNAVDRYRSERRVEQTEQRLTELAENTPDVRWMFSGDWSELLFVNSAFEDLYGKSQAELKANPSAFLDSIHSDDRQYVRDKMADLQNGVEVEAEYRVCPANGEERWVWVHGVPITDDDGEVARIVGFSRDITDSKRHEETLIQQETILAALGDPVYVLDSDGRFTYVNDAFVDLVGYDRDTIIGEGPPLIKPEAAVATAEEQLARILSSDGPETVTFELDVQRKDGERVPCEDHMGVFGYDGDGLEGSAGVLREISERKRRERELEEKKRMLERSVNALDDIYYFIDTGGRIERWNEQLVEVTGYTDAELDGMNALDLFDGDDRDAVDAAITEELETGSGRVEAAIATQEGEPIPYEFSGARLTDSEGNVRGIIGVGRDITERHAYERSLEAKNDRLEAFTGMVSHDLRNPLNVAATRVELARNQQESDHLDEASDALTRMAELIDDMLDLAADEEPNLERTNLAALTREAWQSVETRGATLAVPDDMNLQADPSRLQQLLENLIANAVTHGTDDPSMLTVTVGTHTDGFYVADDGVGIPAPDREVVLESGYSTATDGTGFGLDIVVDIADAHGWTVDITDSESGGTRVAISGVDVV